MQIFMMNVADDYYQGRLCLTKSIASDRFEKRCSTNKKFIRINFVRQSSRILGLERSARNYLFLSR